MNHNFEELAEIAMLELYRGKTRTSYTTYSRL